jgi:hypothetical protein
MTLMTFDALARSVVLGWREQNIARPPATRAQLGVAEARLGARLPPPLVALLVLANGMLDGATDEGMFHFWSTGELRLTPRAGVGRPPEVPLLEFADYCLWTHGYAVALAEGDPPVFLVGGAESVPVAPSFSAFLHLYNVGSPGIL